MIQLTIVVKEGLQSIRLEAQGEHDLVKSAMPYMTHAACVNAMKLSREELLSLNAEFLQATESLANGNKYEGKYFTLIFTP